MSDDLCPCWGGPCTAHGGHCCFDPGVHEREDEHIVRGKELFYGGKP